MEEKTELNDIILNQGDNNNGSKKILLAVASLAIILIIIVVIMNSIQSDSTQNLPKPVLPKEPQSVTEQIIEEDPLFEPVEVIEETQESDNLDKIAKKLKEESLKKEPVVEEVVVIEEQKPAPTPAAVPAQVVTPTKVASTPAPTKPSTSTLNDGVVAGKHYVQVGSFSTSKPNKTFLKKIESTGYNYSYYKVVVNGKTVNKVLIGPFNTKDEARKALPTIRKNVEKGAFITKV